MGWLAGHCIRARCAHAADVLPKGGFLVFDTGRCVHGSPWQLVQARMWAQGLTVGTLLSSALIAGASTSGNKVVEGKQDHSWADLLGE